MRVADNFISRKPLAAYHEQLLNFQNKNYEKNSNSFNISALYTFCID